MKQLIFSLLGFLFAIVSVSAQIPLKWQRTYGEGGYNSAGGIIQTSDNGYVILSNAGSDVGNTAIHLIKTDTLGIIQWERVLNNSDLKWATDFKQTSDKGYIITGNAYTSTASSYDLLLIKTDSVGQIEWEKQVGGTDWDFGNAVAVAYDSAYVVIGKTYSYGAADANIYIVKCNLDGDTLWTRVLGGDSLDFGTSVDITADSNYLIAANTRSYGHGSLDAWIMKLSMAGDTLWSKFYGDTLEDAVNSIKVLPDKGFIFVGYTYSFGAMNSDAYLMRTDSNYIDMWWLPVFWMPSAGYDVLTHVSYNDSLQFVLSGWTTSGGSGGEEAVLTIMGDNWNFKYSGTFGTPDDDEAYAAWQTSDSGYVMACTSYGTGPANSNVYVVKTGPNCQTAGSVIYTIGLQENTSADNQSELSLYPNPAGDLITLAGFDIGSDTEVNVSILNIQGQCIAEYTTETSIAGFVTVDISNISPGVYLVKALNSNTMAAFRLIKE